MRSCRYRTFDGRDFGCWLLVVGCWKENAAVECLPSSGAAQPALRRQCVRRHGRPCATTPGLARRRQDRGFAALSPSHPEVSPSHPEVSPSHPEVSHSHPEVSPSHPEVSHSHPEVSHSYPEVSPSHPEESPSHPEEGEGVWDYGGREMSPGESPGLTEAALWSTGSSYLRQRSPQVRHCRVAKSKTGLWQLGQRPD